MEHEDNQPTDEQKQVLSAQITDEIILTASKREEKGLTVLPEKESMVNLGRIVITKGANEDLGNEVCLHLSFCQMMNVWGNDLCEEDRQANDDAVKDGQRIVSSWKLRGEGYYVITEWDRSCTTILRKDEY